MKSSKYDASIVRHGNGLRRTIERGILRIGVSLLIASVLSSIAHAQATVGREIVEEGVEQIFKHAGEEALNELAEMGGRAAVRELMEQSAKEGGDALVKKVVVYGTEEGPLALRVISRAPGKMVEALDALSPEIREPALRAIDRDPEVMTSLVKRFGAGAAEVAVRDPGSGEILLQKLGDDGLRLGRSLSADQSVLAARHADELAALSLPDRTAVVDKILSSPGRMLDFLEAHPKTLLTAAGLATFLAAKDGLIGDGSSVLGADGKLLASTHPGLIERLFGPLVSSLQRILEMVGFVIVVAIAGWFCLHLVGKWRRDRSALRAVLSQRD